MLELSTTAGYALLALGYLERCRDRWVLAREIARHTGVAPPYLSRILYTLVKAGIVNAKRGYRGGFCLSRPGSRIAVLDVVDAVEHRPREPRCLLGLAECSDRTACPVHALWKTARSQVEAQLARLTLDQIAEAVARRGATLAPAGSSAGPVGHVMQPAGDEPRRTRQKAPGPRRSAKRSR